MLTTLTTVAFCLQVLGGAPPPQKHFTDNCRFQLPLQVTPKVRADLSKVLLWVSKDGGKTWLVMQEGDDTTPHFTVRVPSDGEYWFQLQTIDKHQKRTPVDVQLTPPQLRVVVQSKKQEK